MIKIKEFIERVGIEDQKVLAKTLGVTEATISNWAKGKQFPTHQMEERLMLMGMTFEELFGKELWKIVMKQALDESGWIEAAFDRKAEFLLKKYIHKIENTDIDV